MPPVSPLAPFSRLVERTVDRIVGPAPGDATFDLATGDAGLMGRDAVAWDVHGDFATMLIGGASALMLQMLHPGALAGVWDHSDFRRDMAGRLRRTARFIGGTTYASTPQAEAMIARVRRIHDVVHGTLPDGTPYSANDPHLLAWVHVAGEMQFLAAWRRYREPAMSVARQDLFWRETSTLADRLGAGPVPTDAVGAHAYLEAIRPELRADHRSREVIRALLDAPAETAAMRPLQALAMAAAIDLLPRWAARMHGLDTPAPRRHLVRVGAGGLTAAIRLALASRVRRRDALLAGRVAG